MPLRRRGDLSMGVRPSLSGAVAELVPLSRAAVVAIRPSLGGADELSAPGARTSRVGARFFCGSARFSCGSACVSPAEALALLDRVVTPGLAAGTSRAMGRRCSARSWTATSSLSLAAAFSDSEKTTPESETVGASPPSPRDGDIAFRRALIMVSVMRWSGVLGSVLFTDILRCCPGSVWTKAPLPR